MSDFSRLLENERYEIGGDEAGTIPGEMEAICSFSLLPLLPCKLWALALPCVAWSICWRVTDHTAANAHVAKVTQEFDWRPPPTI